MDKKIYELKEKARKDYEKKLKELEVEYQKDLDAIERVVALMADGDGQITSDDQTKTPKKMMATSQTVREIIDSFDGEFTVAEIRDKASQMSPPFEISKNVLHNVIKQKRKQNKLETVQPGIGRTPAIYKNIKPVANGETLFDEI